MLKTLEKNKFYSARSQLFYQSITRVKKIIKKYESFIFLAKSCRKRVKFVKTDKKKKHTRKIVKNLSRYNIVIL